MQRLSNAIDAITGSARRLVRRRPADTAAGAPDAPRDYKDERETDRRGAMSAEDRAWETASRERSREADARKESPPEQD